MSDQKQSQFIEVNELIDSDYVPVFGARTNRKISKPNLFEQIKDETQIFIYPTVEQLQNADLVADPDWPIYVRVEETGYVLYKITSLAAGINDIPLDNGTTATIQTETPKNLSIISIINVAALRGTRPSYENQQFNLLGYSISGIGGGLVYFSGIVSDASSDNGATIFVSNVFGIFYQFKRILTSPLMAHQAGAIGNNIIDDTAAIQRALAAERVVDFGGSAYTYKINGSLAPQSQTSLIFNRAKFQQYAAQTPIFNIANVSGLMVHKGVFQGYAADYLNTPSSLARCFTGNNGSNIFIFDCKFDDFAYSPVSCFGVNNFIYDGNTVSASGVSLTIGVSRNNTGITVGGTNLRVINNDLSNTAQGLIIAETSSGVVVSNNVVHDIRIEHGMYLDTGITNMVVSGNDVRNCQIHGIKLQFYDALGPESASITINNNVVNNTITGDGISVNNTGGTVSKARGLTIAGNSTTNAGQYGIDVRFARGCRVSGNVVDTVTQGGIFISNTIDTTVSNNTVTNSQNNGIREDGTSVNLRIHDNDGDKLGLAGDNTSGNSSGIFCSGSAGLSIKRNSVTGPSVSSPMQYGLYIAGGTDISVVGNDMTGAADYGVRFPSTAAIRVKRDNYFGGALGSSFNDTLPISVASAAIVTLPPNQKVVTITGTTNITSITATGYSTEPVMLIFTGILTVTDGSNLKLSANFVTSADDTLTLACDGTNWYECGRSAN